MEIEGVDSYFRTVGPVKAAVNSFAASMARTWPYVHVSTDPHNVPHTDWVRGIASVREIDPNDAEVYFARDEAAIGHFRENSYAPLPDGTGVVAVWFRPLQPYERTPALTIPEDRNVSPRRSSIDATFVLPDPAFSVMLLTPTHPEDGDFSSMIWDLLLEAIVDECG